MEDRPKKSEENKSKSTAPVIITTTIVIVIVVGIIWIGSTSQQSISQQNITKNPASSPLANYQASDSIANSSTSYVSNTLPNTLTSIDQKSVDQGWIVIPLGANQIVQLNTSFDDTITDLGQTIPQGLISWAPLSSYSATTGKYVQVNLTVNNLGLNNEGLEVVFAGVFDQAGRYYQYMMGNSTCGNFNATEGTQTLSPDIPCIMNALFEVGQDSNSFTLKLYIKKDF
jgi:hypothetical protein